MLRTLYARLLGFQILLIVAGSLLFWALTGKLDLPEPAAMITAGVLWLTLAAVVLGVLLHPVDQLLLALRRAASGEPIAPITPRAPELAPIAVALARWAGEMDREAKRRTGLASAVGELRGELGHLNEALRQAEGPEAQGDALRKAKGHSEELGRLIDGLAARVGGAA